MTRKPLLLFFLFLFLLIYRPFSFSMAWAAYDHSEWNDLTGKYVHSNLVDYKSFLTEIDKLDYYLKRLADIPIEIFSEYSREERMAFWMNAYNATVVRIILSFYPITSVEEIPHFKEYRVVVAGLSYSLTQVRENIFRQGFRDERATLALVDGTKTALPLQAEAYMGPQLIDQLTDQINAFLTNETYNQIRVKQKKIRLSPLFEELAQDFVLGYGRPAAKSRYSASERAVISFIMIHIRDDEVVQWLKQEKFKISYLPKNMQLNDLSGDGTFE
ncbi:MAG: hypothetical protein COV74_07955 [Candidatus Omnitrophica bacterium CG11_big_fil_rev_8_21_14_0_20_45_26]|uniref:DUF547 domain-containing protein n=1 Tax=Candidatus Abzuiibacterium crystallinum TaxID=1974748 RepID=A0A2H0LMF9_9BACT|nr:MAG: hypothetical protein COV74_07955 [Candidatus Omnitrophica bacterium CG11_big_fil_rev_8_21_14_0_20_45_26]PIW65154.1 MAG: hypothetical protein COW12_02995 [Candidatus Omnitrophica bacterium CG12_big_fil_rev_8_21_14_0_65_45_16]